MEVMMSRWAWWIKCVGRKAMLLWSCTRVCVCVCVCVCEWTQDSTIPSVTSVQSNLAIGCIERTLVASCRRRRRAPTLDESIVQGVPDHTPKMPLSVRDLRHYHFNTLFLRPYSKRHPDRFSRFCTNHLCVQHTACGRCKYQRRRIYAITADWKLSDTISPVYILQICIVDNRN